jgi:cytochrome c-type biogenesis protein CcmE
MKRKYRRLTFVIIGFGLLAAAAVLVISAFEESVVFFRSPTEVLENAELTERRLRIGGLVEEGSLQHRTGTVVRFRITDLQNSVAVEYTGILPDLFREGQGVVAEGRMQASLFLADEVLAKHDENYMPPEVADALKRSGKWQHLQRSMEQSGQMPGAQPQ